MPGSRAEIEGWIKELRAELEHTKTIYPGISWRVVYLEKCHNLIDELLVRQPKKRELESEALFNSEYEYWLEEFQSWRDLYLEAAEKGEAVLIQFS